METINLTPCPVGCGHPNATHQTEAITAAGTGVTAVGVTCSMEGCLCWRKAATR